MNALARLLCLVSLVLLLAACAAAAPLPSGSNKPIEPGDRIGSVTVTKGEGEDVVYLWNNNGCTGLTPTEDSCKADVGAKANVSIGVYDDTLSGKLDSIWAEHTYEMTIEGRPVDLKAFGPIDVPNEKVVKLRAWNVALVADKPGEVTVFSKGVVNGEPFTQTLTYTFSAP
jgi:hypothetical protein